MRRKRPATVGGNDKAISVETVRELLWHCRVIPRSVHLKPKAEAELAGLLEAIREKCRVDQSVKPANSMKGKVKQQLAEIAVMLDAIEKEEGKFLAAAEQAAERDSTAELSASVLRDRLAEIDRMRWLTRRMRASSALEEHRNDAERWQAYATTIRGALLKALASVDKEVGLSSHGGPAGRFFARVVPMLTGEQTAASSAAKFLMNNTK